MWDGRVRKAFHILIHDSSFLLAVYSPPGRLLKRKSWVLFQFHLLSVALVSTLATVSVHFCLCRVGLHTCHSVSPLPSLSRWSPHLPQCQSTASSSVSVAVRVIIPTAPLNESVVNGHRRHSQNSCSVTSPAAWVETESSGEHVSSVTTTTCSRASLSVHVLWS